MHTHGAEKDSHQALARLARLGMREAGSTATGTGTGPFSVHRVHLHLALFNQSLQHETGVAHRVCNAHRNYQQQLQQQQQTEAKIK